MNPFLHPAVATPLDPDDVLLWPTGAATTSTPKAPDDKREESPVESDTGKRDSQAPGTLRVRVGRVGNARSLMNARSRLSRRISGSPRAQSGRHACVRASCRPLRHLSPGWRSAARSLAFAAALGFGACGFALAQSAPVNANVASAAELEAIKGIGPKTARSIISERQRSGPFESFQDFSERIRGIGPKRAASLRAAGLVIGAPASQSHAAIPSGPGTGSAPVGVLVR